MKTTWIFNKSQPFKISSTLILWRSAGFLALLLIFSEGPAQARQVVEDVGPLTITDQGIETAVSEAFQTGEGVPADRIEVKSSEGVVQLSGEVDHLLASQRAVQLAEEIKGVRQVINNIEVRSAKRSNEELAQDLRAALAAEPAIDEEKVGFKVDQGLVTLLGVVDSFAHKQLAEQVAQRVRGVRGIVNDLRLKSQPKRSDAEITSAIQNNLSTDALVDESTIDLEVLAGRVTLEGTVPSLSARQRVIACAWITGVSEVDFQSLEILPGDPTDRPPAPLTDEQVTEAVKLALLRDPRVPSIDIEVEVDKGVATLAGTVQTLQAKQVARQVTRDVLGVSRVMDQLRIRPDDAPLDAQITTAVSEALRRDPYIDRYDVRIETEEGVVTLSGDVRSNFERQQSEEVAGRVSGVLEVRNQIEVLPTRSMFGVVPKNRPAAQPTPQPGTGTEAESDQAMEHRIRDRLFWSPRVNDEHINVNVKEGVATVTGTVSTWNEHRTVMEVIQAGGVVRIRDRLQVRYGAPRPDPR